MNVIQNTACMYCNPIVGGTFVFFNYVDGPDLRLNSGSYQQSVSKGWRLTIAACGRAHYDPTRDFPLRKHAYLNIWKISPPKTESFQIQILIFFFHIAAQNIDCGYSLEPPRRGSNEYPLSMFWAEIWKKYVYPYKPKFYYIKVGFKGVKII